VSRAYSAKNRLTQVDMDPDEIRTTFADRGAIRLDGAFSAESAARIQASVWRYVESKTGVGRSDRSTWPSGSLPIGWKGLDRDPMLDAMAGSPMVHQALDAIFGAGGWKPRRRDHAHAHLPQCIGEHESDAKADAP
jgi:hypothetical protein